MPIHQGTTTKSGTRVGFYQYGKTGKKYTYKPGNDSSRKRARKKAGKQAQAIKARN